jgi:GNAT superfamily N-acetyltransferase
MSSLPLGWATDLGVLELMGSTVDHRGDHIVVRTSTNPLFHWGNCIFVTDADAVDDADRWIEVFGSAVPSADWVAVGLTQMPMDAAGWTAHGVELELDDVLATSTMPRQTPLPDGYTVHPLVADEDWEQFVARDVALNEESEHHEPQSHERFARARAQSYREISERGSALFVGAFFDGRLVGELGIVRCGATARYQTVGTDPAHRGRGICSHLLGVAAAGSVQWGARQWVIVTAATNPAGRVYRRAGFELVEPIVTAYRTPADRPA